MQVVTDLATMLTTLDGMAAVARIASIGGLVAGFSTAALMGLVIVRLVVLGKNQRHVVGLLAAVGAVTGVGADAQAETYPAYRYVSTSQAGETGGGWTCQVVLEWAAAPSGATTQSVSSISWLDDGGTIVVTGVSGPTNSPPACVVAEAMRALTVNPDGFGAGRQFAYNDPEGAADAFVAIGHANYAATGDYGFAFYTGKVFQVLSTGRTAASPSGSCGDPPPDADGDGDPDSTDVCPNDPTNCCSNNPYRPDTDGDGVPDCADSCPGDASDCCEGNPDRPDSDGDGTPDCLDPCPQHADDSWCSGDCDGDGTINAEDETPGTCGDDDEDDDEEPKPCEDFDGDGACNKCDVCPDDAEDDCERAFLDEDGDGVPATIDADDADPDVGCECEPCEDESCGCVASSQRLRDKLVEVGVDGLWLPTGLDPQESTFVICIPIVNPLTGAELVPRSDTTFEFDYLFTNNPELREKIDAGRAAFRGVGCFVMATMAGFKALSVFT